MSGKIIVRTFGNCEMSISENFHIVKYREDFAKIEANKFNLLWFETDEHFVEKTIKMLVNNYKNREFLKKLGFTFIE